MLLNAVIIVLREVLEAALLASILLAMSRVLNLSFRWFFTSLLLGAMGSYIYASNMSHISEWYEYTGQELMNGTIQILIYLAALGVTWLLGRSLHQPQCCQPWLRLLLSVTIVMAIVREGAEITIYMQGFVTDQDKFFSAVVGGLIGASIGASVGVIVYYALAFHPGPRSLLWCQLLLALFVCGILSQVVPLFEQVDILPSASPVWDTSSVVAEDSVIGQLMYAVFGYEATPSMWQLMVYLSGLMMFMAVLLHRYRFQESVDES